MPEIRCQKSAPLAPRAKHSGEREAEERLLRGGVRGKTASPSPTLVSCARDISRKRESNVHPRPASRCEWGEEGAHRASDGKVRGAFGPTLTRSRKLRSRPLPQAGEVFSLVHFATQAPASRT